MADTNTISVTNVLAVILLSLSALIFIAVIGASISGLIQDIGTTGYISMSVICLISCLVIYFSPNNIRMNIPGFGPVDIGEPSTDTKPVAPESKTVYRGLEIEDFNEFVSLVRDESTELANQLDRIASMDASDEFQATSNLIQKAIDSTDSNPFEESLELIKSDIKAIEFIEESENHQMDVVEIDGRQIITKIDNNQLPPSQDLEFKLYINKAVTVNGSTESFGKWVATTKVNRIDDPLCIMDIIDWDDNLDDNLSEITDEVMSNEPWVEIGKEEIEQVDLQKLKDAHEKLKSLQDKGREWQ